jgi:hypothetical protein
VLGAGLLVGACGGRHAGHGVVAHGHLPENENHGGDGKSIFPDVMGRLAGARSRPSTSSSSSTPPAISAGRAPRAARRR